MAVFQCLPSNSVPLCLTSWENQKKSAKTSEKKRIVGITAKACVSKEAYKPDSVTLALSGGGMGKNSPNLLWEAFGRLPETFDPS